MRKRALLAAVVVIALLPGCGTKKKLDTALDNANKLIQEYQRLGKNMNDTLTELKTSANKAAKVAPATQAQVPPIAASATGSVNVSTERDGKTGSANANVDGAGGEEQVAAFVPDVPAGGGTTGQDFTNGGDAAVFASWKGDADSDDAGLCYLAWEKAGAAWFIVAPCGEQEGGYVCEVTESSAACSACNVAGECNACDMEKEEFDCTWPAAQ